MKPKKAPGQLDLFPQKISVGDNVEINDKGKIYFDALVLEVDYPLYYCRVRIGTRYVEYWYHDNIVRKINKKSLV